MLSRGLDGSAPFAPALLSALRAEILEAAVEASELPTGVEQPLLAAGPGRVRFRVDLEAQRVALLAVGRAGLVARPIRHQDCDLVIIRVNAVLHRPNPLTRGVYSRAGCARQCAQR